MRSWWNLSNAFSPPDVPERAEPVLCPSLWDAPVSPGSETQALAYLGNSKSGLSESATGKLRYGDDRSLSEWVTDSNGKRLWWLPEEIRGFWSTSMDDRIVAYHQHHAVMLKHIDGGLHSKLFDVK